LPEEIGRHVTVLDEEIGRHVTVLAEEIEDRFASLDTSIKECYFMLLDWMKKYDFLDELWIFFLSGAGPFLLELPVLFSFPFPFFHVTNFFFHYSYP